MIKRCSKIAGRDKKLFAKCISKFRAYFSLYSKAVVCVFEGNAQPSFITRTDDTTVLVIVAR